MRVWPVGPGLFAYRQVGPLIEIIAVERSEKDWFDFLEDDFKMV